MPQAERLAATEVVIDRNGVRGIVEYPPDPKEIGENHVWISFDGGRHVTVPESVLVRPRAGSRDVGYFLPLSLVELERYQRGLAAQPRPSNQQRLSSARGEHVQIERVPVNRSVDGPISPRFEGDTLVIPVVDDVVKSRMVLREEIR